MILVTGGSGFLGKAIANSLGSEAVVSNLNPSNDGSAQITFDLTQHDRTDELADQLKSNYITQIIHTAAITPWSESSPDYSFDLKMAQTLAGASETAGVKSFIYLSGWNVYDMRGGQPPFDENTKLFPTEEYGKSKLQVEKYFQQNLEVVELTILRLSSVYGPGQMSAGLIPNLVKSALSEKKVVINARQTHRDYLYKDDLLDAIKQLTTITDIPRVMNLGSNSSLSVEEVARTIKDVSAEEFGEAVEINIASEMHESEIANNQLSIDRARSYGLLQTTTDFKEGLKQYMKWVKYENIL